MRVRLRRSLIALLALGASLGLGACSSSQQGDDQLEASNQEGGDEGGEQQASDGQQENAAAEGENTAENQGTENQANGEQVAEDQATGEEVAENQAGGEQSPEDIQDIITDMNAQQGEAPAEQAAADATATNPAEGGQDLAETAPASTGAAAPTGTSAGPALPEFGSKMPYIVQRGDTLQKISQKIYNQGNRWADIAELSSMPNPARIFPGDVVYYQLTEETLPFATKYEGLAKQEVTVGAGDTLTSISSKVYGSPMDWKLIWRHNDNIANPDKLDPGTVLVYPDTSSMTAQVGSENNSEVAVNASSSAPESVIFELKVIATSATNEVGETQIENNVLDVLSTIVEQG